MTTDTLARIVAGRRLALAREGARRPADSGVRSLPPVTMPNPFVAAIQRRRGSAVIAEIKLASPRLGSLAGRFDPAALAASYAGHGAAALSVVVEPEFFGGSYELLTLCQRASGLPAIAKDFVVDPLQIEWARAAGASAVLLIAAILSAEQLRAYAAIARGLGLAPLVETHSRADLTKLAGAEWEMVGVNNRDLRTFEVSLNRSIALLPELPAGACRVAESGIREAADLRRLAEAGFDGFLVGESLLLAADPGAKLRELLA
jgi:indole-3-glycerol phosphate synthase